MAAPKILEVQNLSKTFTSGWWWRKRYYAAVKQVSFDLQAGEILGILGPNGAGKTTIINMLIGITIPSAGEIKYFGQVVTQKNFHEVLRKIAYSSTYYKLPSKLTVYENLKFYALMYAPERVAAAIANVVEKFNLQLLLLKQFGTLSAGQMSRVLIAKNFIYNPEIMLLDEPTAALDPKSAREIRQEIMQIRERFNTAIMITSHNMVEVTELCDRVVVLKDGAVLEIDTPELLAKRLNIAYLNLWISKNSDQLEQLLAQNNLVYTKIGHEFEIKIIETEIASFLAELHTRQISFIDIAITKPSLEDYFVQIAGS